MRSIGERLVHVVLFEAGALLVVSPVVAAVSGASLVAAGATSLVGSGVAALTALGWTWLCDRWTPDRHRPLPTRMAQALGLELLLALYSVPVFVFLGASLRDAVLLEVAVIGFFAIYTFAYNTAFDAAVTALWPDRRPLRDLTS